MPADGPPSTNAAQQAATATASNGNATTSGSGATRAAASAAAAPLTNALNTTAGQINFTPEQLQAILTAFTNMQGTQTAAAAAEPLFMAALVATGASGFIKLNQTLLNEH